MSLTWAAPIGPATESIDYAGPIFLDSTELYQKIIQKWQALQMAYPDIDAQTFIHRFVDSQIMATETPQGRAEFKIVDNQVIMHIFHKATKTHLLLFKQGETDPTSPVWKKALSNFYYQEGQGLKNQKFFTIEVTDWVSMDLDPYSPSVKPLEGETWSLKRLWTYLKFRPVWGGSSFSFIYVAVNTSLIYSLGEGYRWLGKVGPNISDAFIGAFSLLAARQLALPLLGQLRSMGQSWQRHIQGMATSLYMTIVLNYSLNGGDLSMLNPGTIHGLLNLTTAAAVGYALAWTDGNFVKISQLRQAMGRHDPSRTLLSKLGLNKTQLEKYLSSLPSDSVFIFSIFLSKAVLSYQHNWLGLPFAMISYGFSKWLSLKVMEKIHRDNPSLETQMALAEAKKSWNQYFSSRSGKDSSAAQMSLEKALHAYTCGRVFN